MVFSNFTAGPSLIFVSGGGDSMVAQPIDINLDGWVDVVVFSSPSPYGDVDTPAVVLRNMKDGTFAPKSGWIQGGAPGNVHPRETITADFNGDGLPDVFLADHGLDMDPTPGHIPSLLLSKAGGGLLNAQDHLSVPVGFTHSADAGDIDGDGDVDIYVGNIGGGDIGPYFLINDGTAHFTLDTTRLTDDITNRNHTKTTELLIDADGDSDLDLFLGEHSTGGHTLLINDGTGHFSDGPHAMPLSAFGTDNAVTLDVDGFDFNKDGLKDVLLAETPVNYGGRALQLLISNGDGSFTDQTSKYLDSLPRSEQNTWIWYEDFVDINSDGVLDLAVELMGDPAVFYINDGTNHFTQLPDNLTAPIFPLLVFDANHDGRTDLVHLSQIKGVTHMDLYTQNDNSGKNLLGSNAAETILGANTKQAITGLGGSDFLFGAGGRDTLNGGNGADTLMGGLGQDVLSGGAGKDRLLGGGSSDKFVFNIALKASNRDVVVDFKHGTDRLVLDDAFFKTLGTKLEAKEFYAHAGAVKANDKSDRIVYDTTTGRLYFDGDGTKKHGVDAIWFATLDNKTAIDHTDFSLG